MAREELESEIFYLWKEAKKRGSVQQNFAKKYRASDDILNSQSTYSDKTGLGYKEIFENGSISSKTKELNGKKTYVETDKISIKQVSFIAELKAQDI